LITGDSGQDLIEYALVAALIPWLQSAHEGPRQFD
jgi:hypothetical protein